MCLIIELKIMNKENVPSDQTQDSIFNFLSGNATDEEIKALRTWINLSQKNSKEFIKMKISWMASAQLEHIQSIDVKRALLTMNKRIDLHENNSTNFFYYRFKQIIRVAAVFILSALIGSLLTYLIIKNNQAELKKGGLVCVYAPKGSKAMTVLPDGTQVWLNAGSNLSYNIGSYDQINREVTLIGQGFFKVMHNPQKPFVVSAKNLKIKALGTEFDIKAYPEENTIETILVKGIVKVEGKDQKKQDFAITMSPKQKVTFYAGKALIEKAVLTNPTNIDEKKLRQIKLENPPSSTSVKPLIDDVVKTDLYTSWKDDRWVFEGEEIGNLAILLERRFNISIVFNCEELKHYKFTGIFQQETLEQILKVLKLTAPLSYNVGKGTVDLTIDPDLKMKYKKYINR